VHLDPFQALAEPTRRLILERLASGECQVNELVAELPIHQSGVSRHLRILSEAGFVRVRADGQRRLYSLRAEPFQQVDSWMSRYRALWEGRLDRLGAALEQRRTRKPQRRG
jgi:DNA-binding transcriptional ArsR family regulator